MPVARIEVNIDWQRLVLNLKSAGFSCEWIGRKIRMDPAQIRRLGNGVKKEPTFSQGLELLNVHADLCPDKHSIEALQMDKKQRPYLRAVG